MVDVLKLLQPFEWRGAKYPITRRRVSFRHEGVEHVIQYRDFALIEQLGAHGLTFSYTMPMRESIAKGPYEHLFERGYAQLVRDALDRTPGPLIDPILGSFRCTPQAFDDDTDVTKRCGTDVSLEFKYAPELADEDPRLKELSGIAGIASEAGRLDEEVAKVDWGQEPSPEPMQDPLLLADGLVNQVLAQKDKYHAALADAAFKAQKIENTCDKVKDPATWGIRDNARKQREATIRMQRRLNEQPATKLRTFVVRAQVLLSALAREVGMTIDELVTLNPSLTRRPYVPAGAVVIVKAKARAA